jgi:phage-related protein
MRKFALKNANDEVYELNDVRNFFHTPSGLGFERSIKYKKIGNRYEIIEDDYKQAQPTGYICFKDEPNNSAYTKYMAFSRFLQKIPLTLYYRSDREHHIDVIPSYVEKSEISKPLGLNIAITFDAVSLWYDKVIAKGVSSASLLSDSIIKSPCHITITGILTNPTWRHNVNDTQVATGQVTASIGAGESLHIRTDTNPYRIYKVGSGGAITDLYGLSNFSTKRFFLLEEGNNTILCNGAESITVEGEINYETV